MALLIVKSGTFWYMDGIFQTSKWWFSNTQIVYFKRLNGGYKTKITVFVYEYGYCRKKESLLY
ncbi:MAG: hypothetical protein ACTTJH_02350 [Bacteroidales bacterium]